MTLGLAKLGFDVPYERICIRLFTMKSLRRTTCQHDVDLGLASSSKALCSPSTLDLMADRKFGSDLRTFSASLMSLSHAEEKFRVMSAQMPLLTALLASVGNVWKPTPVPSACVLAEAMTILSSGSVMSNGQLSTSTSSGRVVYVPGDI